MEEKHFLVVHTFTTDEKQSRVLLHQKKEILQVKEKHSENGLKKLLESNTLEICKNGLAMMNSYSVIGSPKVSRMFTGNLKKMVWREKF